MTALAPKALALPALMVMAAGLAAAPARAEVPAQNHTVTLHVPVEITAMPYVKSISLQCHLSYGDGSHMAYERTDLPLAAGEFHGKVDMKLTAPDFREGPTGWFCDLFVFPSTTKPGFTPKPWGTAGIPQNQYAAQGTVPVTHVEGTFGPKTIGKPQGPATVQTPAIRRPVPQIGPAVAKPPVPQPPR